MSEKLCVSCKHFEPLIDNPRFIGSCKFPLPAWLNNYLTWTGDPSKRFIEKGWISCQTYEVQP